MGGFIGGSMSKFYIGSEWESKYYGKVVILDKVKPSHSKVMFKSTGVVKVFRNDSISSGNMSHPDYYSGSKWSTTNCGQVEVIKEITSSLSKKRLLVRFINTGTEKDVSTESLKSGKINDPYSTNGYWGVGCLGETSTLDSYGKNKKSYNVWHSMLKRCYVWEENCKAYKDVFVCEEWLCYERFEKWFDTNYKDGFELDKDFTKIGNKVYCPEFCSFIPHRINGMLSPDPAKVSGLPAGVFNSHHKSKPYRARCFSIEKGMSVCLGYYETPEDAFTVYKTYKEGIISSLAEKCFKEGCISSTIFENLNNYEIK